jgi:tRNA(Ile)-lysidine synthase
VRAAVRRFLAAHNAAETVAVACSGGADSLTLAAATVHSAGRLGLAVHGLVVDHQLQLGSAQVAQTAAQALRRLGVTPGPVHGAARSRAGRGSGTARPHSG